MSFDAALVHFPVLGATLGNMIDVGAATLPVN